MEYELILGWLIKYTFIIYGSLWLFRYKSKAPKDGSFLKEKLNLAWQCLAVALIIGVDENKLISELTVIVFCFGFIPQYLALSQQEHLQKQ